MVSTAGTRLFLLGLLVGPVMLLVSLSRARRARSLRRIEERGTPAWARVTRIRQAAESKAHRMLYTLRLQARTDDGATFVAAGYQHLEPSMHAPVRGCALPAPMPHHSGTLLGIPNVW